MKYPKNNDLESFYTKCKNELLDQKIRQNVVYPNGSIQPWDSDAIKAINEELLKSISGNANVYAIFVKGKNKRSFDLKYIGQTNSKYARTRLTNHLIKKHKKTGAKLKKVIEEVQAGSKIKVSWISIEPQSLRHYIEEELIKSHSSLEWNQHGKTQA